MLLWLLARLGISPKKTIELITAPLTRIVNELHSLADAEEEAIRKLEEELAALKAKSESAALNSRSARSQAKKIEALLDVAS